MSLSVSRTLQPLFYWLYMFVYKKAHKPDVASLGTGSPATRHVGES